MFWQGNISVERPASLPRLHIITDDVVLAGQNFRSLVGDIASEYGDRVAIHLRGPHTSGAMLYDLAAGLVATLNRAGAMLLVNDRVDVALAANAHGGQLGARGMPLHLARRLLGADRWLGASVHSDDEAMRAVADGADFLIAGTLYQSRSHPERAGAGIDWLGSLTSRGPPVIGIGGITPERIDPIRAAGVHGAAVLSGIWDSPDPIDAVRSYLNEL